MSGKLTETDFGRGGGEEKGSYLLHFPIQVFKDGLFLAEVIYHGTELGVGC